MVSVDSLRNPPLLHDVMVSSYFVERARETARRRRSYYFCLLRHAQYPHPTPVNSFWLQLLLRPFHGYGED
jgi:hypothetical protein